MAEPVVFRTKDGQDVEVYVEPGDAQLVIAIEVAGDRGMECTNLCLSSREELKTFLSLLFDSFEDFFSVLGSEGSF